MVRYFLALIIDRSSLKSRQALDFRKHDDLVQRLATSGCSDENGCKNVQSKDSSKIFDRLFYLYPVYIPLRNVLLRTRIYVEAHLHSNTPHLQAKIPMSSLYFHDD